ncbi:MAG: hypothetical protein L0H41_15035 [Microlunatus sp.]|nr:hypothetical protein [Microlunatus sp.]MDN5770973.1 hypothetical protein [Microlunatus sp.]
MTNTPSEYDTPPTSPEPGSSGALSTGGGDTPAERFSGTTGSDTFYDSASTDLPSTDVTTTPTSKSTSDSTKDVAKDEAANVKDTAADAGKRVGETAKGEAANVADETKRQATSLLGSVTDEVQTQAGSQQQKIASSVHALSQELDGMASGSSESGPLTDLAHQAADKGGEIARWLENREPRDVLREVQDFGRRRPVMFLALCGLAGVVAGRLTRGAVAANTSVDSGSTGRYDTGGYDTGGYDTGGYDTSRYDTGELGLGTQSQPTASASLVEELPPTGEDSYAADLTRTSNVEYGDVDPGADPAYRPGEVR